MKLGDRVRIVARYSPHGRDTEGVLMALPVGHDQGIVFLDEEEGHNGAHTFRELSSSLAPGSFDPKTLRETWERGELRWWFVTTSSFFILTPKRPTKGHVPGLHTCSKGCGFTNDYVDASAFATGEYVCFQCSLWARKCEW
jgi:hypothetical protein